MNIFDFINSKDIREHLKKIDYPLDALEASWIVYHNGTRTLKEKMEAWNWIIDNMNDCEVPERINCIYRPSLFAALRNYMALIDATIEDFYKTGEGIVYRCEYKLEIGDVPIAEDTVFSSANECWKFMDRYLITNSKREPAEMMIIRKIIDDESSGLKAHFSMNRELLDVYPSEYYKDESDLTVYFFDGFWFDFPVPFERGDLLVHYRGDKWGNQGPIVLDDITPWIVARSDEQKERYYKEGFGDETDMTISGYFMDKGHHIYREVTHNYMDYELYRNVNGVEYHFLRALSNFVKGKLSMEMLLEAYGNSLFH